MSLSMFQNPVRRRIAPGVRYVSYRKAVKASVSAPSSVLRVLRRFAVRTTWRTRTTVNCDRPAVRGGRTRGLSIRVLAVSTSLSYLVKALCNGLTDATIPRGFTARPPVHIGSSNTGNSDIEACISLSLQRARKLSRCSVLYTSLWPPPYVAYIHL